MEDSATYHQLIALLHELGVRTAENRADGSDGFPLEVPLLGGGSLLLDLPTPGLINSLDPDGIGAAVLDSLGYVRRSWGLAKRTPIFREIGSLLNTQIGPLLESTYQGSSGSLYLDGFRYFTAGISSGGQDGPVTDVFVLVVNAQEERQARKQADRSWRLANTLKRLGKALTMNQNMRPMCNAAAHEIASSAELAGVLIWTHELSDQTLRLASNVGVNRLGVNTLNVLTSTGSPGCLAELVATTRQSYTGKNVLDHVLSSNLEAKFCYLKPGAVSVHPLVNSDRLLGVLEMIGREDDPLFQENAELFETVSEQLALALNTGVLFEELERLASHDPLTGLANHRTLQEFLQLRLKESERTGQELGVIMIDVDHFRSFNEEEGHDVGDAVLRLVAESLKSCLREYDLAARYGGEEFTIVMPGSSPAGILTVAERVRARVESTPFETRSGRMRHLTVSLGCSMWPACALDPAGLLKAADLALYESKRNGRNRVTFFQGKLVEHRPISEPVLDDALQSLLPEHRTLAEKRLVNLDPWIDALTPSLKLSVKQAQILRALVAVERPYRDAQEQGIAEEWDSRPEMRLLLPALACLGERWDGKGPNGVTGPLIPLLARILAVLGVMENPASRELIEDPGRLDPEILALIADLSQAA